MKVINYVSLASIPIIILIIILWGISEKKPIFDTFLQGATEGAKATLKIFPTLIGIFFSIELLKTSGIIDFVVKIIAPITSFINFPAEVLPLALVRPISGSGAIGIATNIMKNYGVDSLVGRVTSVIMGSTETTLYTIAVYTSCVKIKNNRGILVAALTADLVRSFNCSIVL